MKSVPTRQTTSHQLNHFLRAGFPSTFLRGFLQYYWKGLFYSGNLPQLTLLLFTKKLLPSNYNWEMWMSHCLLFMVICSSFSWEPFFHILKRIGCTIAITQCRHKKGGCHTVCLLTFWHFLTATHHKIELSSSNSLAGNYS